MKSHVKYILHTAQVFLLEEWYEADREEKKEEVEEGRMVEEFYVRCPRLISRPSPNVESRGPSSIKLCHFKV